MNVNQVVNAPKKSNNVVIIIGASVLVCCLFSLYLTFMRSRDEGKELKEIERLVEEKPSSQPKLHYPMSDVVAAEQWTELTLTSDMTIKVRGSHQALTKPQYKGLLRQALKAIQSRLD